MQRMKPFDILGPLVPELPIVVDIPHSGMAIPDAAADHFAPEFARSRLNTDWFLDRLFGFLVDGGITVLRNNVFRYVIDVNRRVSRPYLGHWTRSLVAREKPEDTPFDGRMYISLPTDEEIEQRIEWYYRPYHDALRDLITEGPRRFDRICLVSMHSFVGGIEEDICIADGKCDLCIPHIMDVFESAYAGAGLRVVRNKVFGGGYITRHYGTAGNVDPVCVEHRCSTHLLEHELDQPVPPSCENRKFREAKAAMRTVYARIVPGICNAYGVSTSQGAANDPLDVTLESAPER